MEDEFSFIDDGEIVDPGESREGSSKSTRYQKGESGNLKGRPKGSRNKASLAVEALLDGEAEVLTRKLIEAAKDGDMAALKFCLERIVPVRRSRSVSFDLPDVSTTEGVLVAYDSVLEAVATGELTPDEGETVARLLEAKQRVMSTTALEKRVKALELMVEGRK